MTIPKDNTQLENAEQLRREMTPHERKLWYLFLRKYPVQIYKQRIIGRFIVGICCASASLVIELDGSQQDEPQGLADDAEGSPFLISLGLEVLRFSNRDIDRDFRGVCTQIDRIIQKRLQDPLSSSKGRARYIAYWHEKWSVSVSIRSIHCFSTAHQIAGGFFCLFGLEKRYLLNFARTLSKKPFFWTLFLS